MAAYTHGNRRSGDAKHWDMDGDYQPTTNGGRWRSIMVEFVTIRTTAVKQHTRRSWSEGAQASMCCSAEAAPMMASTHGWKPTDFSGRPRRAVRPVPGSTTSAEEG